MSNRQEHSNSLSLIDYQIPAICVPATKSYRVQGMSLGEGPRDRANTN
jgi:hypothetical protein